MHHCDLTTLIELSYDAVFDDAAIQELMAAVNAVNVGGFSAFLFAEVDRQAANAAVAVGVSEACLREYNEKFSKIDIMWRARHQFCRPRRVSSTEVIDLDDLKSHQYYKEFLRQKNDVQRIELIGLSATEKAPGILSVNIPSRLDHDSVDLICHYLEGLQPHLRRVMRLRRSRLSAEVEAAANIVNCLSTAAALFATDGTLLDANEAAERILAPTGDEVGCERAELSLGDDGLQRIVRSFAESGAPARTTVLRDRGGGSVLVHAMRRDPEKVGPLTRLQRVHEKLPEPCVLVLLKRPGEVDGHATRVLAESFGLTPAETRLAMLLMEGRPMAECASVLGISRNTARNQLASTMGKTASRSQADLVRLFASGGGGTCHSTQPY